MSHESVDFLNSFIKSINYSTPQNFRNLTVFPLYSSIVSDNSYMLLDEALKTDRFRVQEISEGGSVPELEAINELDSDVLIPEGEILIGAKQNRTVNTTIIIGKGKKVVIPVSCVERGRWSYSRKRRSFDSSDYYVDPDIRKIKTMSVSDSMKKSQKYRASQSEIWDEISNKMREERTYSETESVSDIYESKEEQFKSYEKNFSCGDAQIGIAVFTDFTFSGCDIFGCKGVLPKTFHKIIKSYIFEGIRYASMRRREAVVADYAIYEEHLNKFFDSLIQADKQVFKSVGEGYDIRIDNQILVGFAIEHNKCIAHLTGFQRQRNFY